MAILDPLKAMPGRKFLLGLLVLFLAAALMPVQAQIAFRSAASAIGPASGTIAYRNSNSASGGSITFRAAANSGTPTPASPVFRQVASAIATSGVLTLTINVPAGTLENDVMIAGIAVRPSSAVITAPSGWTLIRRIDNAGPTDSNSLAVYYRVAGATEASNYGWSFSASTGAAGGIQSFSSVDIVSPIVVENGQTTTGLAHATPDVSTGTVANTMLVTHHGFGSSQSWTPPAGMTESFDVRSGSVVGNAGESLEGNRVVQAVAGATGAKSATAGGNADAGNAHILALRPALRIPLPANVALGDLLLAAVAVAPHTAVITPPAGWTLVRRTDNAAANANSLAVYWKVAGATEPGSYLFGIADGTAWVGSTQAYSGVDAAAPINVESGSPPPPLASSLTHTAPSITTSVANTMVVTHHSMSSSSQWSPPPAGGPLPILIERIEVGSLAFGSAGGVSMESASAVSTAAGATGTKTATASANADVGNAQILALRPSARSLNITRPASAVQNDVMIAAIGFAPDTAVVTPPAGWTLVQRVDNSAIVGGTSNALAIFRKVHALAEPASYTWTFSADVTVAGGLQAFSGVDLSDPIDLANGQGTASAATHATPSITTTVPNAMLVTHHTMNGQGAWTPPAGFTESYDVTTQGGAAGQSLEGARALQAVPGASGAKTATSLAIVANRDKGNAHILALRPASATKFSIPTPAGTVANDVLIAAIAFTPETAVVAPTVPGDWALIQRMNNTAGAGTNNSLAVYRRVATGAEPGAHEWTFGAAPTAVAGGIQGFSGVDATNPVVIANGQNTALGLTHPTPSVNTSPVANTMLVTAHAYATSRPWTPPTGMAESYDLSSLTAPNAGGVSIEGSRVNQAAAGLTGAKTASPQAGNNDKGNAHIVALRPAPVAVPSNPTAFNGCESASCTPVASPLTYAALYTKLAGTAFTLRAVALKADGTLESGFDGAVTVELLANANTGVALGGNNCPTSQDATISLGSTTFTAGRATIAGISVASAYRDVRMKFSCTAAVCGSDITRCSSDNFAIRPSDFAVSSTNANADGTGASSSLTPAVKAGASFNLTATALASYNGTPSVDAGTLGAHSGAVQVGALGGSFGAAAVGTGAATGNFTYSEVGYFRFAANGVYDDGYTSVDQAAGDCTNDFSNTAVGGKYGCKFGNTVATNFFGRFVPDRLALTVGSLVDRAGINTGASETCTSSFTYMGEDFKTDFTLLAQNSSAVTTQNYTGGHAKFDLATWANYGFSASAGTLVQGDTAPAGSWGTPLLGVPGAAAVTATHKITRPAAPAAPYTSFVVSALPSYTDGAATIALAASAAVHAGSSEQRFGRLRLVNAYGSELQAMRVPVRAEYATGANAWALNAADNCTSLPANAFFLSGGLSAGTSAGAVSLGGGSGTLILAKPSPVAAGIVDVAANLGSAGNDQSCLTSHGGTAANMPWLRGFWTVVGNCNGTAAWAQDPNARVRFGSPKAPYIYLRERY